MASVCVNGWMGGLTDCWVEDGRPHYVTSYGGEDSVPLEQIDFGRPVQLNAERRVEFVLRANPRPAGEGCLCVGAVRP